jgi:hypothetical protein
VSVIRNSQCFQTSNLKDYANHISANLFNLLKGNVLPVSSQRYN